MKIFLDSADIEEIKECVDTGLIDGVTTNPSLIAKVGKEIKKTISEICTLVEGPVSAEVVATTYEEMMGEALSLSRLAPNVVIKVPLTKDGLKACKSLREKKIKVNVTLCFSPTQALLAAKAGANFISPFIGRLDDLSSDGLLLIEDIHHIYQNYPLIETEILAASIRHPLHVLQAAKVGADVVTLPPKIFLQLYEHPLTHQGLEKFLSDWANIPKHLTY
jgi:transaldolase